MRWNGMKRLVSAWYIYIYKKRKKSGDGWVSKRETTGGGISGQRSRFCKQLRDAQTGWCFAVMCCAARLVVVARCPSPAPGRDQALWVREISTWHPAWQRKWYAAAVKRCAEMFTFFLDIRRDVICCGGTTREMQTKRLGCFIFFRNGWQYDASVKKGAAENEKDGR